MGVGFPFLFLGDEMIKNIWHLKAAKSQRVMIKGNGFRHLLEEIKRQQNEEE